MGKLYKLKRAIKRNPQIWRYKYGWGSYSNPPPARPAVKDKVTGEWRPVRTLWEVNNSKSYVDFVDSVLRSIRR